MSFTQVFKSYNGYLIFQVDSEEITIKAFGYKDDRHVRISQIDELKIINSVEGS